MSIYIYNIITKFKKIILKENKIGKKTSMSLLGSIFATCFIIMDKFTLLYF